MDKQKLAQIVREARGTRSQGRFARELGVNTGTVRNWEMEISEPSLDNLKTIADYTGRSLIQLITEITGEEAQAIPEPRKVEDVIAIASKLSKSEQFRLLILLASRLAEMSGLDIEED